MKEVGTVLFRLFLFVAMIKTMRKQSGFSIVEVLLIVIVLAVIGFGGWYVWYQSGGNTYKIVDHYACSDFCEGDYSIKIYEGVTDEKECERIGGDIYWYYGWGEFTVCKVT